MRTYKNKTSNIEHDQEHRYWSRKSFLQALGIVGSGSMMLSNKILSASKPTAISSAISNAETDNILVLVRLSGGNDGLSTVIPINQFDAYANARPNIHIPENQIIKLTDEFGIPDYMSDLERIWGEGQFKAIHGVGMDTQSLSHFTGSEVWSNADINTTSFQGEETGWMGRHFDETYPDFLLNPPDSPPAIQIGNFGDIIFSGTEVNYGFTTSNVSQLESIAQTGLFYQVSPELFDSCTYDNQLKFLREISNTTYKYSGIINDAYSSSSNQVEYNNDEISTQLALIARLIKGNLGTKVYMITLGGFDTHSGQPERHKNLMSQLTGAINSFYADLNYTGHDKNVLSMTYSEFGRRIDENGSSGTDHGKAAPMLMFGAGLNGSSFVGSHPSLELSNDRGNLEYNIDFRDVYATILGEWMCVPTDIVERHLLGRSYTPLDLGFNCSGTVDEGTDDEGTDDEGTVDEGTVDEGTVDEEIIVNKEKIDKIFSYSSSPNSNIIHIEKAEAGLVDVQIFDLSGKKIANLFNEIVLNDVLEIDVQNTLSFYLTPGIYIYRVEMNNKIFSKKISLN